MTYNYIEIGTADFRYLAGSAPGPGISIEPVKHYLDRLPTAKDCIKLNAAITEQSGTAQVWYMPESVIEAYNLPKWVKGCNSMHEPHPTIKDRFADLITEMHAYEVQTITAADLCNDYNVSRIRHLKVDAEGYDAFIVMEFLKVKLRIDKITLEVNELADKRELTKLHQMLIQRNYTVKGVKSDWVCTL